AGACFCCKFDDLLHQVERLATSERPDVILAEPVGSCTDLVATVAQPLKDLYGERFQVAPYAVLFKPSHGLRILRDGNEGAMLSRPSSAAPAVKDAAGRESMPPQPKSAGFSPKAAYIFRKQLEEADAIAINRIDEMTPAAVEELAALVQAA